MTLILLRAKSRLCGLQLEALADGFALLGWAALHEAYLGVKVPFVLFIGGWVTCVNTRMQRFICHVSICWLRLSMFAGGCKLLRIRSPPSCETGGCLFRP